MHHSTTSGEVARVAPTRHCSRSVSGVASKGWYGVPEKLIYSFPAVCSGGNYEIKTDFKLDAFGQQKLKQNIDELLAEREAVADLL